MPLTFRCYTDSDGRDVIRDWYDARDGAIQGEFVGIIENLQRKSRAALNENIFKALGKRHASNCIGFYEIRIDSDDGHHYRVLGTLDDNIFTMLFPFYKDDRPRYGIPCKVSNQRKLEVTRDRRRAKQCEFPPLDED
jgi:hypothetical protein